MKAGRRGALVASLAALLSLPFPVRGDELRVAGTGSALGTMRELGKAFARAHPGTTVSVLPSIGSGGAVKAATAGAVEVGVAGRPLTREEREAGAVAFEYARTPLVLVAGPKVDVPGVTAAELARLLRGETTSWPGGERVRLVLRPRYDVDVDLLRAVSPDLHAALEAALRRDGMIFAATNQECNEIVARTPGAIGISSLAQVLTETLPVRPLAWNGVAPTVEGLASGRYPLSKPLFVVVKSAPSPGVRRFLAFLAGEGGRGVLRRSGSLAVPFDPPGGP